MLSAGPHGCAHSMESLEDQSPEELQANLTEYRGQLQQARCCRCCPVALLRPVLVWGTDYSAILCFAQVEQLLLSEPNNQEYEDLYNSITEV